MCTGKFGHQTGVRTISILTSVPKVHLAAEIILYWKKKILKSHLGVEGEALGNRRKGQKGQELRGDREKRM